MKHLLFTKILCPLLLPGIYSFSRNQDQPDLPIDTKIRNEIADSTSKKLKSLYIFLKIAVQSKNSIQPHNRKGEYNKGSSCKLFTDTLKKHLFEGSHDKHYRETKNEL
jgi:hypothetical protein